MIPTWAIQPATTIRGCLVMCFGQQFSVFKQYYTYFHIFFHPHVFSKNTNNVTKTMLLNNVTKRPLPPSANMLKEMKKTVSYMPNTTRTRPQMVMTGEVQTQNDAVKTRDYSNHARVYSLSFCSSFYLTRHVAKFHLD